MKFSPVANSLKLIALSGSLSGGLVREGKEGSLVVANPKLYKSIVQRLGGYEKKLLA
jgi:hypothetical protein